MKFDDLLALYLYEKKTLQLQGIGNFILDERVTLPQAQDKEIYYPIEGLTFTYSPKDLTNEDLIAFLVKKLGKIQPLVRSDLESYLSNIKQFINIGKPYTIEGIGTLQKNNQGVYEFTPGNFLPVKEELSPHRDNPEHLHRQRTKQNESGRNTTIIIIIAIVTLVVVGAIWGAYVLLNKPATEQTEMAEEDSTDLENVARAPDTMATAIILPATNINDSIDYKMIFDVTKSRQRILSRSERLTKDGVRFKVDTLYLNDSLYYRMFIPKKLLVRDTLRVRDSLVKFFQKNIIVEQRKQ